MFRTIAILSLLGVLIILFWPMIYESGLYMRDQWRKQYRKQPNLYAMPNEDKAQPPKGDKNGH